jgi:hypothetical protein
MKLFFYTRKTIGVEKRSEFSVTTLKRYVYMLLIDVNSSLTKTKITQNKLFSHSFLFNYCLQYLQTVLT